jgi:ParB-like chromosome segregation protein Spo0J
MSDTVPGGWGQRSKQPIDNVKWVDVNLLDSNDYNPNHVMGPEMRLLAFSIKKQGWIQPILVWPNPNKEPGQQEPRFTIIDGFHRHLVTKTDKEVWNLTGGKVPVVIMDMTEAERMLLTIRINRAKGNHAAFKMHEIVSAVVENHGLTIPEVCEAIGADQDEIETLLAKDVFEKKKVDQFNYSTAWVPPHARNWGMTPQPEVQ